MNINIKNKSNLKRFIGIIIAFVILITSVFSGNMPVIANSAENKNMYNKDSIIEIPLNWSKNDMYYVDSSIDIKSNRDQIYAANYFDFINRNRLLSPENCIKKESWINKEGFDYINKTGGILRTPMMVTADDSKVYTIDYRNLEKWFEPEESNGKEPVSLPITGNEVWDNKDSISWRQSIGDPKLQYNTQDWYMFRGIFNLSDSGIDLNNIDQYKFYLAMPNRNMILGVNDLVSVFVDEHSTEINYATPPSFNKNDKRTRKINIIARDKERNGEFISKNIIYKDLSTERYGGRSDDTYKHGYNRLNLGSQIDGWHADLNNLDKDGKGNVVLGDVTDIIKQNIYGNNSHMIDMLASEWCNNGGITRLALYAVKKPTLKIEKIAYVKANYKDKIKESDIDKIKTNQDEDKDIILNTNNNIPDISADVPVYFKFKVSALDNNVKNVVVTDKDNNMGINYEYKIGDMNKDSNIIIKDEKNLRFENNSTKYSDLNKEFYNTVKVSGTYFNKQLITSDSNSLKIKTNFKPNISVEKKVVQINNNTLTDFDKNKYKLVAGDKVKFDIVVANNSDKSISGLSLKDILTCNGEKDKVDWKFNSGKVYINPNNFTLQKYDKNNLNNKVTFSTIWNITNINESEASNIAYVEINGYDKQIKSNKVDLNIKGKTGTINIVKRIKGYEDLNNNDKNNVDKQLFVINLIDNTDNKNVQSVAIKNGQIAKFEGLKYGHKYTIKESVPMNYKLDSISNNKSINYSQFEMEQNADNSTFTITNSYSDNGWFEWYENVENELRTAINFN